MQKPITTKASVEAQMTRRRVLEVVLVVAVLVASGLTTWTLLREVAPVLPGPTIVVGLPLVVAVDVAAGMTLRGFGHLQLALSSGSNLVLEGLAVATMAGWA